MSDREIISYRFNPARNAQYLALRRRLQPSCEVIEQRYALEIERLFQPGYELYKRRGVDHMHFAVQGEDGVSGHIVAMSLGGPPSPSGLQAGSLGFFECEDDPALARRLLLRALEWLRSKGTRRAWIPMDFDIWHGYRVMTMGFDEVPFYGEPRNPQYYPALFEAAGFHVLQRWRSVEIVGAQDVRAIVERWQPRHHDLVSTGYRFEQVRVDAEDHVGWLHELETRAFEGSPGHMPISLAEYSRLFRLHTGVLDLRFSHIGFDPDGRIAGFSIVFLDPFHVAEISPSACPVFFLVAASPTEIALRHGIGTALCYQSMRACLDADHDRVMFAIIGTDNASERIVGSRIGDAQRAYALYEKLL